MRERYEEIAPVSSPYQAGKKPHKNTGYDSPEEHCTDKTSKSGYVSGHQEQDVKLYLWLSRYILI
jgi:hypothetical protein